MARSPYQPRRPAAGRHALNPDAPPGRSAQSVPRRAVGPADPIGSVLDECFVARALGIPAAD
jgi:hypothetical protein